MSGIKKRAKRLACRLGLDANPLRRRTDKIATCLAAQLLLVCLVGAPLLGMAAFGAWNFTRLPIDAVPDITNVGIVTESHSRAGNGRPVW